MREAVARHETELKHVSAETKEIFDRLRKTEIDAVYASKLAIAVDERVTRHKSEVDKFVDSTNKMMHGDGERPGVCSRLKCVEDFQAEQKNSRTWVIHTVGYIVIGLLLAYIAAKLGIHPSQVTH